ncbi:MAG TPA: hypothetical protein VEG64_15760 [Candidatus Sulfotelmatobacter sp.]|nr:hypothetical protein [Candidatus Sulfotelmatobacter sp.]
MPEASQISFSHREIVETLLKRQGIYEGIWGLFVKFALNASNIGPSQTEVLPAAIVGVVEIGLQKFDHESNIAVDAAKVNPRLMEAAKK